GDVTRSWKLSTEDPNDAFSAYYWSVNAFKSVVFLDLKNEEHLNELYRLVKIADIVLCNYRHGEAKQLRTDYQSLKRLNPALIYANIFGFADSGRPAYD